MRGDPSRGDPTRGDGSRGDPTRGTSSRDVLAGWGWTTGSSAIVDDGDHFEDHARASRKRLVIAIGGALAGVLVIAGIAFAFRSPAPAAVEPTSAVSATAPSATAPSATAPSATAPSATAPSATGATPDPAAPSAAAAVAAIPAPAEPVAATEPVKVEAPAAEPAKPEPVAVAPPTRPEPVKPAPVVKPTPVKPAPLHAEPKKLEAKKPEPKAVDKAAKRPQVARVAVKAQPVDPYAIPTERTRADPAAAYRTGLQQYAHGDTTGALTTFRVSLASNPGFAPTWRGLGLVYEKLGNKSQARAAFRRYLQLAPAAGDAEQIRERLGRLGS